MPTPGLGSAGHPRRLGSGRKEFGRTMPCDSIGARRENRERRRPSAGSPFRRRASGESRSAADSADASNEEIADLIMFARTPDLCCHVEEPDGRFVARRAGDRHQPADDADDSRLRPQGVLAGSGTVAVRDAISMRISRSADMV